MSKRITNKQRPFNTRNFYSCHPPGVKKGFIKGEALRLLRTNSSHSTFNKNMQSFKTRLKNRGYPNEFLEIKGPWKQRQKHKKENIAFCNTIPPGFTYRQEYTWKMAPYSKSTVPKRNISWATHTVIYRKRNSSKDTLAQPRTGGSVAEHRAVTREVVSSTPTGLTLRVLK